MPVADKINVLIVEDDPMIGFDLSVELEEAGFNMQQLFGVICGTNEGHTESDL